MRMEPMNASLAQSSQRLQPTTRGKVNTGALLNWFTIANSLAVSFLETFPVAPFYGSTAKAADYFTP